MKKFVFYSFLMTACLVTVASNAFGEAGATSRNYSIDYSFTPSGGSLFSGSDEVSDVDNLRVLLPQADPVYSLFARGITSQSDYRSEVGSGVSFGELGAVDLDFIEMRSQVENTQRFYLSDDDGDGLDDIVIDINTFLYGNVGLYNPYGTSLPLNITFGDEGFIEVGYRFSVTAESDTNDSWNTMLGTGGAWSHEFASSEQTMVFDQSGVTGNNEILLNSLDNNTFGAFLNIDAGKPFDVTISLETWIVGQNFSTTGNADDRLAMSSNLHDTYPTNNLCFMEVVAGGLPTSPVPEPSLASLLLCLMAVGALLKTRKRDR